MVTNVATKSRGWIRQLGQQHIVEQPTIYNTEPPDKIQLDYTTTWTIAIQVFSMSTNSTHHFFRSMSSIQYSSSP